jgi:hypothetical protein
MIHSTHDSISQEQPRSDGGTHNYGHGVDDTEGSLSDDETRNFGHGSADTDKSPIQHQFDSSGVNEDLPEQHEKFNPPRPRS